MINLQAILCIIKKKLLLHYYTRKEILFQNLANRLLN